jgi:hypothetical protein
MKYPLQIQGFEGQSIEVEAPGFFTPSRLLVNGLPAPKDPNGRGMVLRRTDGKTAIATWKPQLLGLDVPQLDVDGKIIRVVEPLRWYEWLWSGLPLLLIAFGGLLGAAAGAIGLALNLKIFRSSLSELLKFLASAAVSMVILIGYLVVAVLIEAAISAGSH